MKIVCLWVCMCVRAHETFLAITLNINLIFVCHLYFACHSIFIPSTRAPFRSALHHLLIYNKFERIIEQEAGEKREYEEEGYRAGWWMEAPKLELTNRKKRRNLFMFFFSLSLSVCRWHSNFLFKTKSLRRVTFFYQVSSSSIKNSMHSHTLSISFQMCCSWIPSSFYYGFANTLACSRALHLNVRTSVCNVSAK